jgi:hypothetical protein
MTAQELITFIQNSTVSYNGKTLLQWAQLGSVPDLRDALFDLPTWDSANYTLPRDSVAPGEIWTTFYLLPQWPSVAESVKNDIARVVRENPFPIGNESYATAVSLAITDANTAVQAAWDSLKTRKVSFGEKFSITEDMISIAIGSLAV